MTEEKNNQELYSEELAKLNSDPAHYMTPGARRYFKRVWRGYLFLTAAMVVGIWGVTHHIDAQLRGQINTFLVASCKSSIPTLTRFNQGLQADIDAQQDALFINQRRGDAQRAALNLRIIADKKAAKIKVPTVAECEQRGKF
jgi:hypothetical protein